MIHTHDMTERGRPLLAALALTTVTLVGEVIGGVLTGSLALLADAGHMFSDLLALGLSLAALWIAGRPHTDARTFGLHRAEVLAAAVNAIALIVVALLIFVEALRRFSAPPAIVAGPMLAIAALGLVVNLGAATMLYRGSREDLNLRGAFLHVLGDTLGSVGALTAGLIILLTGWLPADPLVSIFIGLLVLISAVRLLRDSVHVLLESAPPEIKTEAVRAALREVPGIKDVHDLHIWTVTSGFVALSAHAMVGDKTPVNQLLKDATEMLSTRFGIRHATIQPETESLHAALEAEGLICCLDGYVADRETQTLTGKT